MTLPLILLLLFLAVFALSWMKMNLALNTRTRFFPWWFAGVFSLYGAGLSVTFILHHMFP